MYGLRKREKINRAAPLAGTSMRAFTGGFTLIELMIVITIIFILIGIAAGPL